MIDELTARAAPGPWLFPADTTSDQPEALVVGELIREKFLHRLRQELPHSLAVVTGEIEVRDNGSVYVPATLFVERKSQKAIVIGRGGSLLRDAGAEARQELETLFGSSVFLDLRVKVEPDWQHRDQLLDRMGY